MSQGTTAILLSLPAFAFMERAMFGEGIWSTL